MRHRLWSGSPPSCWNSWKWREIILWWCSWWGSWCPVPIATALLPLDNWGGWWCGNSRRRVSGWRDTWGWLWTVWTRVWWCCWLLFRLLVRVWVVWSWKHLLLGIEYKVVCVSCYVGWSVVGRLRRNRTRVVDMESAMIQSTVIQMAIFGRTHPMRIMEYEYSKNKWSIFSGLCSPNSHITSWCHYCSISIYYTILRTNWPHTTHNWLLQVPMDPPTNHHVITIEDEKDEATPKTTQSPPKTLPDLSYQPTNFNPKVFPFLTSMLKKITHATPKPESLVSTPQQPINIDLAA